MESIGKISYSSTDCIDSGRFGTQYLGRFEDTIDVCVTKVKKIKFSIDTKVLCLAQHHPNILRYYCSEQDPHFVYVATELSAGSLLDVVFGDYKGPEVGSYSLILCQVTMALEYLHRKGIFHRDLKPSNVLVSRQDGTLGPVMKLANFGIRRIPKDHDSLPLRKVAGSKDWMAPEVYEKDKFTAQMDTFSLGCLFGFSLSAGRHPFGRFGSDEVSIRIRKKLPMTLTPEQLKVVDVKPADVLKLIESMLNPIADQRPSPTQVLQHEYFASSYPAHRTQFPLVSSSSVVTICYEEKREKQNPSIVNSFNSSQKLSSPPETKFNMEGKETGRYTVAGPIQQKIPEPISSCLKLKATAKTSGKNDCSSKRLLHPSSSDLLDERFLNNKEIKLLEFCGRKRLTPDEIVEFRKLILDRSVDVNLLVPGTFQTPLLSLCHNNTTESMYTCLKFFLERKDIDLELKNRDGYSILTYLCRRTHSQLLNCIRVLVWSGADVNGKTNDGWSALLFVCSFYKRVDLVEIVRFLVQNGADLNISTTTKKWCVLHSLFCRPYRAGPIPKFFDVVQELVNGGANCDWKDFEGANALVPLVRNHYKHPDFPAIAHLLISRGISVNTKDQLGDTALILICLNYSGSYMADIIRLLIECGADLSIRDRSGRTAADLLKRRQHSLYHEIASLTNSRRS